MCRGMDSILFDILWNVANHEDGIHYIWYFTCRIDYWNFTRQHQLYIDVTRQQNKHYKSLADEVFHWRDYSNNQDNLQVN